MFGVAVMARLGVPNRTAIRITHTEQRVQSQEAVLGPTTSASPTLTRAVDALAVAEITLVDSGYPGLTAYVMSYPGAEIATS
jgi:hypothetical protein